MEWCTLLTLLHTIDNKHVIILLLRSNSLKVCDAEFNNEKMLADIAVSPSYKDFLKTKSTMQLMKVKTNTF